MEKRPFRGFFGADMKKASQFGLEAVIQSPVEVSSVLTSSSITKLLHH
jgi:hypothetical protein